MSEPENHRAILRRRGVARFASAVPWTQAGTVNSYVLLGPPHVLVDPGYVDGWEGLRARMAADGIHVDDVEAVLLTHGHPDHAAAVEPLLAQADVPVYLHPADHGKLHPRYVNRKAAQYGRLEAWFTREGVPAEVYQAFVDRFADVDRHRFADRPPLRPLADGQRLCFAAGTLRVVTTAGHTPGHVVLVDDARRIVLSGDHVLARVSPNAVLDFDDDDRRQRGFLRYLDALERVASFDAALWCPGHGPSFHDLAGVLSRLRRFYARRQRALVDALDGEPATSYTLSRRLFPSATGLDRFLAFSEVLGHADALLARGELHAQLDDGRRWLRAAEPT